MSKYRIVTDDFGFFWVERRSFSHIDYELGLECGQWITSSSLCKTRDEANEYLLGELMNDGSVFQGFEIISEPDSSCCNDELDGDTTSRYFEVRSPDWFPDCGRPNRRLSEHMFED